MKQRKIILCALCIFYGIAAGGCLLYDTSVSSVKTIPAVVSPDTASDELFDETESEEAESIEAVSDETCSVETAPAESDMPPSTETASEPDSPAEPQIVEDTEPSFTPIPFTCKTTLQLNVRDIPSMEGKVIAKIKPGEQGGITDIIDENWVAVHYQDITGYCASRYLEYELPEIETEHDTVQSDSFTASSSPEDEPDSIQNSNSDYIIIKQGCYIRSTPDWRSSENILRVADTGTFFPHIPEKDTPSFYAIQLPDRSTAYISVDYSAVGEKPSEE
ncbi:MAG: SH3 domain-containing protein [Lachnospiraceae bacterium]|nr:SH3 domain-containing protein [Lachnospiraceae bacterium]